MSTFLTAFLITVIIVYVLDWVEFPKTFLSRLSSIILKREVKEVRLPKLLECSLCLSTWVTLIFYLFTDPNIWYLSLVHGFSTKYILYSVQLIDQILSLLFITLETLFTKIKNLILY